MRVGAGQCSGHFGRGTVTNHDVYFQYNLYVTCAMQTKLTLRLDDQLIRRAKTYAQRSGKSVSELVADMFRQLKHDIPPPRELTPATRSLAGALKGSPPTRDDHRQHLVDKHS